MVRTSGEGDRITEAFLDQNIGSSWTKGENLHRLMSYGGDGGYDARPDFCTVCNDEKCESCSNRVGCGDCVHYGDDCESTCEDVQHLGEFLEGVIAGFGSKEERLW